MKTEFQQWQDELNGVRELNLAPLFLALAGLIAIGALGYLTFSGVL